MYPQPTRNKRQTLPSAGIFWVFCALVLSASFFHACTTQNTRDDDDPEQGALDRLRARIADSNDDPDEIFVPEETQGADQPTHLDAEGEQAGAFGLGLSPETLEVSDPESEPDEGSDPAENDRVYEELFEGGTVQLAVLDPHYGGSLPDDDPRVLGVFQFRTHRDPIVDGDTVAVYGLDASLRLLGLDTEETFHGNDENRPRAYSDFGSYLEIIYGEDPSFPKFATPMGEMAKAWAREFFAGDTEVRLEVDDFHRSLGYYNRYLVYVFVQRDGEWVNYNVEAVRAGMTPYFTKYGYSMRFHDQFVEAQNEAREAERGIWGSDCRCYPDYEERLEWWDRRGDAIAHFRAEHGEDPLYVDVTSGEDWATLWDLEGQYITVFGTFSRSSFDSPPYRVGLSHRITDDFTLIAWDMRDIQRLELEQFDGEYVYMYGQLGFYNDRPQFIADRGVRFWTEPARDRAEALSELP